MSAFLRVTRGKAKREGIVHSADVVQGSSLSSHEACAVRKLQSDGWAFKTSSVKKQRVEPATPEKPAIALVAGKPEAVLAMSKSAPSINARFIGETQSLQDLFTESSLCRQCKKGSLQVTFETVSVATTVHTRCTNSKCRTHCASSVLGTGMPTGIWKKSTDYAANCLLVLSLMLAGDGGSEAGKILGLLHQNRRFGLVARIKTIPLKGPELWNHVLAMFP